MLLSFELLPPMGVNLDSPRAVRRFVAEHSSDRGLTGSVPVTQPDFEVAVIGAGPGGITAATCCARRASTTSSSSNAATTSAGPGATTTIPAWPSTSRRCGTSSPSRPTPNWTRFFAPGPEIYRYLRDTAPKLGLYRPPAHGLRGHPAAVGRRARRCGV